MLVRNVLLASVITLSILAYSISSIADERSTSTAEARQVAESVVKSFMAAYDTRDPKAISALFLPDTMLLGFNGAVSQGREAIERTYAAALKNLGGHYTIVIKDAIPLGSDVVVASDESQNWRCWAALRRDH
jgi:ketosteroid isomerase-like protein